MVTKRLIFKSNTSTFHIFFCTMSTVPCRIPYEVSRIEKTLTVTEAMMVVPTQTLSPNGPVWFVSNPPSWAVQPIMGRVIGQKMSCAWVTDRDEDVKSTCSAQSSIPSPPPSPITSRAVSRSLSLCETHLREVPAFGWEDFKQDKPAWYSYWFTNEPSESRLDGWSPNSEISKLDGWSPHSDDEAS